MHGLRGKRVWISGASGALGSQMVETFLALGCHVVASARRRTRLLDLRAALQQHDRLHVAENDASDPEGVEALLEALWRSEPLDIAIQCAGHFTYAPLSDTRDDEVQQLVRSNVLASAWLLRGCLERMLARGQGDIVLVAADKVSAPTAQFGFYGASKAAVAHMIEVAQQEAEGTQVRPWGLLPGTLDTPANREAGLDPRTMLPLPQVCTDLVTLLGSDVPPSEAGLVALPLTPATPLEAAPKGG